MCRKKRLAELLLCQSIDVFNYGVFSPHDSQLIAKMLY